MNDISLESIRVFIQKHQYSVLAIIGTFFLFISNFIISPNEGIYMTFLFVIILLEFLVGSIFLLFNTTSFVLAIFFQDSLSEDERVYIRKKLVQNGRIMIIWILIAILTFLLFAPYLGIISAMYLFALVIIFNLAGVEENPFLETRYGI